MLMLGRAAAGIGRGMMRGDAGNFAAIDRSEIEKKIKKVIEDIKLGKIKIDSLDQDTINKLGGEEGVKRLSDAISESQTFGTKQRKILDVVRSNLNTESIDKKDVVETVSFKSTNGSFDVSKSMSYNTSKIGDQVPTHTPKPGSDKVSLEGSQLKRDIKILETGEKNPISNLDEIRDISRNSREIDNESYQLRKSAESGINVGSEQDFGNNLNDIDPDAWQVGIEFDRRVRKDSKRHLHNLQHTIDGPDNDVEQQLDSSRQDTDEEDRFSNDSKSSHTKRNHFAKLYDKFTNKDSNISANKQLLTDFDKHSTFTNPGNQRLNRNIANQIAAKKASPQSSSAGGQVSTGGPQSGSPQKTGPYDPIRGERSESWIKKTFDPFKKMYNNTDTLRDSLDYINNQAQQVDDPMNVLMKFALKHMKGESDIDMGDGAIMDNNISSSIDNVFMKKGKDNQNTLSKNNSEKFNLKHHENSTTVTGEQHLASKAEISGQKPSSKAERGEHKLEQTLAKGEHKLEQTLATATNEQNTEILKLEDKQHNTTTKTLESNKSEDTSQRNATSSDQTSHKESDAVQQKEAPDNAQKILEINNPEKLKLEFIDSFSIESLPKDLHETAKNTAEQAYKYIQEKDLDINKCKEYVQKILNDENLRKDFIKVLDQERAMIEAEKK